MQGNRLNLAALKGHRPSAGRPEQAGPAGDGRWLLSRRTLLTTATAAAFGLSPGLKALRAAGADAWELVGDPDRVAFVLDGVERWVIDARRFSGAPALQVRQEEDRVRIELTGAWYPGSDIPADMQVEVLRGARGWKLRIDHALGNLVTEAPFGPWLVGAVPATGRARPRGRAVQLGPEAGVEWSGPARAAFLPDGSLYLQGAPVAVLHRAGQAFSISAVTVALMDPAAPSLMEPPRERGTQVTLHRGRWEWPLWAELTEGSRGALRSDGSAFDLMRIELAEGPEGRRRQAMVAESHASRSRLFYQPDGIHVTAENGQPLTLPLADQRFAVAFDQEGDEAALFAEYLPLWVQGSHCRLRLGSTAESQPFSWLARNGRLQQLICAPAVVELATPLQDALIESVAVLPGGSLALAAAMEPAAPEGVQELPPRAYAPEMMAHPGQSPAVDIRELQAGYSTLSQTVVAIDQVAVVRPEDLLNLRFQFINFSLVDDSVQGLYLQANVGAVLVVHFPPQHIGEEAFLVTESDPAPAISPPIRARVAGPSRLAFQVPAGHQIPFTLQDLLNWRGFQPSIQPPYERNGPDGRPAPPATKYTAIEAPYHLVMTPGGYAAWVNATAPATHDGRTELWHTRLGVRSGEQIIETESPERTLRAIYTPDWFLPSESPPASPFIMSLFPSHRRDIVGLTSDPGAGAGGYADYVVPVQANWVMLSPLGAWIDLFGAWDPPNQYSVLAWMHKMLMGRDRFVRIVTKGYLFPFGHEAALMIVTEREIRDGYAYLQQRRFVVVTQPVKQYGGTPDLPEREMPFREVRLRTLVTPLLDDWGTGVAGYAEEAFWLRSDERDIYFRVLAEDWEGRDIEFTQPLMFVSQSRATDGTAMSNVAADYRQEPEGLPRRSPVLGGATVAYAPGSLNDPLNTSFDTQDVVWDVQVSGNLYPGHALAFRPVLKSALIRVSAIEELMGTNTLTRVRYFQTYLDYGFTPVLNGQMCNAGEVYLVLQTPVAVNLGGDKSVGVITPQLVYTCISRVKGAATGQPNDVSRLNMKPAESMGGGDTRLFGAISLNGLLPTIEVNPQALINFDDPEAEPPWWYYTIPSITMALGYTDELELELSFGLEWEVPLQSWPANKPLFVQQNDANGENQTVLKIGLGLSKTLTEGQKDNKAPSSDRSKMSGKLDDAADGKTTSDKTEPQDNPERPPRRARNKSSRRMKKSVSKKKKAKKKKGGSGLNYELSAAVENFTLDLIGPWIKFISLDFKSVEMSYSKEDGAGIAACLTKVRFYGPLTFVNAFARHLTFCQQGADETSLNDLLDDLIPGQKPELPEPPPEPPGIDLDFGVNLPGFAIGVFGIIDLAFSAGVTLYLSDHPMKIRLEVCDLDDPFHITAYGLAGGGAFGIHFTPDKIKYVAVKLEFGGNLAFAVAVASGKVYAYGGVLIEYHDYMGVTLTGYFRMGGEIEILGLMTVTLEVMISLSYNVPEELLWGRASLTFSIKILFFRKRVSVTIERQFYNGPGRASLGRSVAGSYPYEGADDEGLAPGLQSTAPSGPQPPKEQVAAMAAAYCRSFRRPRSVYVAQTGGGVQ